MKKIVFITLFISFLKIEAQSIHYNLRMPKPQNHYFEVEMVLTDFKEKQIDLKLPVWAPGSYLVREFSKNINLVKAYDQKGNLMELDKKTKNSWSLKINGEKKIVVKYEVYAFELSVRTSFLDLSHGFVSGSGVFMYAESYQNNKGTLDIFPHSTFAKITTALPKSFIPEKIGGVEKFTFEDYDQLVDCPIEIGNQVVFDFMASGVKHTVAMYGEGNYDIPSLKTDMTKIIEAETAVFGENPNKEYVFIVHNVVDGQGGLEHKNSTTLSVNRWTYATPKNIDFLNLVAHEYFHLWNVKRIRPIELGPFDYDHEVYTSLLWVMEGVTSYYDELILRRAGFYSQETFLNKLMSSINYVEGSAGSRVQPVAHASFDAWIKAYRPNENSSNTTMTYYSRGMVIAAVLDAMIIKQSNGKECLDHLMQDLYQTYYVGKNRGFTDAEFKACLTKHTGQDMTEFFLKYIDGTEVIPYSMYFLPLGIEVNDVGSVKPVFGANVSEEGGKVIVKSIRSNTAAEDAGLSVNDEIIACMNYRVDKPMLDAFMNGAAIGDEFELTISRDQLIRKVIVKITGQKRSSFIFTNRHTDATLPLYTYWLR